MIIKSSQKKAKYNNNDIKSNDNDKRGGDTNDKITNSSLKNFNDDCYLKKIVVYRFKHIGKKTQGYEKSLL